MKIFFEVFNDSLNCIAISIFYPSSVYYQFAVLYRNELP